MRKALSVLCALLLLALPLGSLAECAHIWRDGAVLTEGTCVTQGERQIVCTKCGAQSTRTYYGPHCYTTWWDITPATCTSKGLRHYVCRNCDYEKTQETSMLPHNYGAWTTLVPASMYSLSGQHGRRLRPPHRKGGARLPAKARPARYRHCRSRNAGSAGGCLVRGEGL